MLHYDKPRKEKTIDHMTVKPVGLMERLIEVFSAPGQVVLDPFLGSGTTGVAAAQTGRRFVGIELEPRYFKMAETRISEAYGRQET